MFRNVDLRLLPVYALYLVTFGFTAYDKIISLRSLPPWYLKMFNGTFLGSHSLLLNGSYWMITAMEILIVLGILASIVNGEYSIRRPKPVLLASLTLALFTFVILSFGMRLISDHQGSASLFFYCGATWIAIRFVETRRLLI
jgi:hypothetical protein